jgi:hypothetical protein
MSEGNGEKLIEPSLQSAEGQPSHMVAYDCHPPTRLSLCEDECRPDDALPGSGESEPEPPESTLFLLPRRVICADALRNSLDDSSSGSPSGWAIQ